MTPKTLNMYKALTVELLLASWDELVKPETLYDVLQGRHTVDQVWADRRCVLSPIFDQSLTPAEVADLMAETLAKHLNFHSMLSTSGIIPVAMVRPIEVPQWSPTWLVTTPIPNPKTEEPK